MKTILFAVLLYLVSIPALALDCAELMPVVAGELKRVLPAGSDMAYLGTHRGEAYFLMRNERSRYGFVSFGYDYSCVPDLNSPRVVGEEEFYEIARYARDITPERLTRAVEIIK